jgi:hypothetical protein
MSLLWCALSLEKTSVDDPDPHVFGPPGSGSGSISQRHGSADPDPDPHQNVMDPQHWEKLLPMLFSFWSMKVCVLHILCVLSQFFGEIKTLPVINTSTFHHFTFLLYISIFQKIMQHIYR